ncbi:hypothetical protein ACT6QG_05485 [Xanthobacter sp. TB0136]|uniref:hypothetical protein n=1 Tax=Xanthobacter sp. TB0136 TaxID=3459177 RepID=UPI00403A0969
MSKITNEELRKLLDAATPGPWSLCHHLRSKENDEGCSCGYRGVVFGPELEGFAVCQPGHDPAPVGQEGLVPQRYPRATELANAQLIAHLPDLAAELLKLRERNAQLLNYCSATVHDLQSALTTLEALDLRAELPRTVASLKDASEFMRLAAENKEDHSKWQDEISVRNSQIAELREAHERQQEMVGKLVEALRFALSHVDFRIEVGKRAEAALSEWEAHNG